jgi:sporulation protein YlmC with PRC-barrel domain
MNVRWNAVPAAAACVALIAASATAQVGVPSQGQPTPPSARQGDKDSSGRVIRVTKLLDANVRNAKGEKIGEIEDLVIDRDEGVVAYGVLSFGGFLGIGEKYFAIPFQSIKRSDDDKFVVLDVSKDQLEHAPNFTGDAWPDFDRKYGTTVHDYYKAKPYWNTTADASRIDKDALDKDKLRARGMVRASKMIGMNIQDPSDKKLGDVDDVVVDDTSGRVAYVVLSFGGFLGMGDKLFAIPWHALRPDFKNADKMVLDVPKDKLQAAPGFDKKNWPNMADRTWGEEVHKYYGQRPYWDETNPNSPANPNNH